MNAIWVRRFVDLLVALFALVLVGSLVQMVGSIMGDTFGTIKWEATGGELSSIALGENAEFSQRTGTVAVEGMAATNAFYWAARFFVLGLMLAVFLQLRRVLGRIATGEVFGGDNIASLRRIGWFLLAASVASILATIVIQAAILNALPPVDGIAVHPSLSWDVQGGGNIWLEYSPPIEQLLLACIAFLTASAFAQGRDFREDSESVV